MGDPPPNIYEYIKSGLSSYYQGDLLEFYIKSEITTYTTNSPDYYNYEIKAYTYEKELFKNVSAQYAIEREYSLWVNQRKYEIAKSNYKQ